MSKPLQQVFPLTRLHPLAERGATEAPTDAEVAQALARIVARVTGRPEEVDAAMTQVELQATGLAQGQGAGARSRHRLVFRLAVEISVERGWHVNSDEPGDEFSLPTEVEFELPDGIYLVGNSWGGQYAALYHSARPERVSSVVMIEPGPFTGELLEDKMDEIRQLEGQLARRVAEHDGEREVHEAAVDLVVGRDADAVGADPEVGGMPFIRIQGFKRITLPSLNVKCPHMVLQNNIN